MKVQSVALLSALGMLVSGSSVYLLAPASSGATTLGAAPEAHNGDVAPATTAPEAAATFSTGTTLHMEGRLGHGRLEKGGTRTTYVMVEVHADGAEDGKRVAENHLAIVIDRSGSMKGDRLPRALAAANAAVDHLEDGDRVSVISFDTRPTTDVSMTTVNPSTRQAIRSAIQNISLGGDTCISCGIQAGVEELRKSEGAADRMIVLSDGDATAGVRDVPGFESIARSARDAGIGVSTIGVGTSYNQKIMGAIALHSGGRHHFIEDAASLERVFLAEADKLRKTVAVSASVTVDLAEGVTLERVFDRSFTRNGQRLTVPLGNFSAGDTKTLLLELRVPADAEGITPVADVRLGFDDRKAGGRGSCSGKLDVRIGADGEAGSELDPIIATRIERTRTADTLDAVNELLEQGRTEEAEAKLAEQEKTLREVTERARRAAGGTKGEALAEDLAAQTSTISGAKKDVAAKPKGIDKARAQRKYVEAANPYRE
ncbi:VWA domain-containing protein [Polyangium sp. 15x6]|uniref:vWA domain-containing protein n=1 Tax=Polyangium sp. 15x6 TaxID=3042687 RepID=UPI00249B3752|nr:VWA domain-containing protein [Polyangium sp. 15x6]MDI3288256.1 VWA domain-containing protein [Polyangium sp. 15x6]